jgi:phosphopantetheine adenylyltransferase
MRNTIPPKTEKQLKEWNDARLEIMTNQRGIENLEARIKYLRDRMDDITRGLENVIYDLEQPLGLRIGDDYVVLIQDSRDDSIVIQTVNFNFRQEIIDS